MITNLAGLYKVLLASSLIAIFLAIPLKKFALHLHLVDMPGAASHKTHINATPMAGGLILPFSLLIPMILIPTALDNEVLVILVGTMAVILLGLMDDRYSIKPLQKISGQILIGVLLYLGGIQVHITQIAIIDALITLLWIVGITNAFNFVDSMDGLAVGIAGISASFLMLVTIESLQPSLALLSAAILGSCVGLFFYNVSPAKIFLGDSGSQSLGFALAACAIAYTPAQAGLPQGVTWFIPILVLGVPIFDTALIILSRLRSGNKIYLAAQDHAYHRLVSYGLDPTRAVAAMHVGSILLGFIAFITLELSALGANLLFGIMILIGVILLYYFERDYHPR